MGTRLGIDPVDWDRVWSAIANCSFNTATLETVYKVILRWYWVPAQIAHANPTSTIAQTWKKPTVPFQGVRQYDGYDAQ